MTRESALTYTALAFLAGLIIGLASCTPEPPPQCSTATENPL